MSPVNVESVFHHLGCQMKRLIEGEDRAQAIFLPELLGDNVDRDNPVRVVDEFIGQLGLGWRGFECVQPDAACRPAYHLSVLLKLYIYGYLNRIQSIRRLEREAQCNAELMWLMGRLRPTSRRLPTSKNTAAIRSALSASSSSFCVSSLACLRMLPSQSTVTNSGP
jgi:transposase